MTTDVMSAPPATAPVAAAAPTQAGALASASVAAAPTWLTVYLGVVASAVLALGGLGVSAVFTDSATTGTGNAFTTGSVDLTTSPSSVALSMPSMMPGDKVTAPVTVTNTGTATMRYALKSTTTEDILATYLDFTIKTGVASCDNDGFNTTGTTLYGPGDLGSTAGRNVVGNPASGGQAGDRVLAAGANEVLCMQVSLPFATDPSYQGRTTTATFDFMAEQTANNP